MQERHSDGKRYFRELAYTSEKYLLPFIEGVCPIVPGMRVLEIGCGMGGNLAPFVQRGCRVTGVDLGKDRIENAALMLQAEGNPDIELIAADIFTVNHLQHCFDLVIVHDVIEHIPDKDRFFKSVRDFLKPGGVFYIASELSDRGDAPGWVLGSEHINVRTPSELSDALLDAGFTEVSIVNAHGPWLLMEAIK